MKLNIKPMTAGWILAIVYLVGIAGFSFSITAKFMPRLIWVNLLFTFLVLMVFHKKWSKEFVAALFMIGASGFMLEVIGVSTRLIFGAYFYGPTLGIGFWRTPIMMFFTWITTVYITRQVAETIAKDAVLVSFVAACLMVLLDYFIEPFAIRYGMWAWDSGKVPLHNYIGWFVSGFVFQYLFIKSIKFPVNKLSLVVYLVQLGFFISLYLLGGKVL